MCPPNQTPKKKKNRKLENEPTAASKLMEYIISKNETVQPQHPVDTFLASIASTLKTFSPYHVHLAKAEIFNTVHLQLPLLQCSVNIYQLKYKTRKIIKTTQHNFTFISSKQKPNYAIDLKIMNV